MSAYFCGNPQNHVPHIKDGKLCSGVGREEKPEEVIIEKFDPKVSDEATEAEDATPYSTVTIVVEDNKGGTSIVRAEKVKHPRFEVDYETHLPVDGVQLAQPRVEQFRFIFEPQADDGDLAFTLERKEKE